MRFLVDECTGPAVAHWLCDQGHDVFSVYDTVRGIDDDQVIKIALEQDRIIITNDKDFGEKVYRDNKAHRGVILLRLTDERSVSKINVIANLLKSYAERLPGMFIVVSEKRIKLTKPTGGET
ncbi:DUF5615 family PIN-like protein [Planctomycetota bacterium]